MYLSRIFKFFIPIILSIFAIGICFSGSVQASQLSLFQSQYLGESSSSHQQNGFTDFLLQLSGERSRGQWTYGGNLVSQLQVASKTDSYFALPEAYVQRRNFGAPSLSLGLGAIKQDWSYFDQEWSLGIWEPNARWDYIHPYRMGLPGLHLNYQQENFRALLFVSDLFIPDLGPNAHFEDGRIESENRWFYEPVLSAKALGMDRPIRYSLEEPKYSEIIFQPSFGAHIEVGPVQRGAFLGLSYADKPLNQIQLMAEVYSRPSLIEANLHAFTLRHQVASLEGGYRGEELSAWLSLTSDEPERHETPPHWLQSQVPASLFFGGALEHRMSLWSHSGKLKYAYLQRWDRQQEDEGSLFSGKVSSFLERFPYERALSVEWAQALYEGPKSRMLGSLKYLYSLVDVGSLLSLQMRWKTSEDLELRFAMDILGSESESVGGDQNFFGRFRSNDRVMVGMSYAF